MQLADNYTDLRAHKLVHAARNGVHTIPQALADDYDELLQLIKDGHETVSGGYLRWANRAAEQKAEAAAARLNRISNYGGVNGLIAEHIQPALAEYIAHFRTDWRTAGAHAARHGATIDMLSEPDDVRAAIVRLHEAPVRYGSLRNAYTDLRGGLGVMQGDPNGGDPRGVGSILAEVRNINDLVPDWQTAGHLGHSPWPWASHAVHVRLGWFVDNGAEFWAPTALEHNERYREITHVPAPIVFQPAGTGTVD